MSRILIVDDEEMDREAARRCLRAVAGAELLFAPDGEEALQIALTANLDAVVTDLRMPHMDGLTLVEHIHDEVPYLPVVLMTSKGNEEIAVKALKAGAASYVPKRDLEKYLLSTIRQVLEIAHEARQQRQVIRFLTSSERTFQIGNDLSLVGPLAGYLKQNLEQLGFGDNSVRSQISIAIMEALSNAIIHGNLELDSDLRRTNPDEFDRQIVRRQSEKPYSLRRITCLAHELPTRVEYVIEDEGPGFDSETQTASDLEESLLDIAGRGIMLIRTFMDDVAFNEKGNRILMSRVCS